MSRRVRIIIGVLLFIISVAFLVWSYKPLGHEIRTQPISPSELQLPTPSSFLPPLEFVS